MMTSYFIICASSFLMISAFQTGQFPEANITNGLIHAHLYLPDASKGYYQATRFDWSGVIASLEYNGHNYYGQWFEKYSPETHDAVMGPVEEFTAIGYAGTKPGESFLKIGVGALIKPDESAYSSFKLYQIANPGKWKVKKKSDQIQFIHVLNDEEYAYEYKKTVQLTKGKSELVISHTLKNTGSQTIETSVYDHNFPVIDKQPTGPGFVISFKADVTGIGQGIGDIAQIKGNQITFLREVLQSDRVFCSSLLGLSNDPIDYDIKIENLNTGAGIRITCDRPISKLVFWASPKTVCPEPYIHLKVEPGQEFSWKISYEYYTIDIQK